MDFQDLCALTETMKLYLRPLGLKRGKIYETGQMLASIEAKPAAFEADNIFKSLSSLLENGTRRLSHIARSEGVEEGENLSESVDRFERYTLDRHRTSFLRSRLALRGGNLFPKMMKQLYRLSDFHGHGQRLDVEVLVAKAQSLAQIGAFQAFAQTVIEFSRNVYSRSDKNFKNTFNFWLIVALQIFGERNEEEVPHMLQHLLRSRRNQSETPTSSIALKLACLHTYFQYRLLSLSSESKPIALLQKVFERATFKSSYHLEFSTVLAQSHALFFSYCNLLFGVGKACSTEGVLLNRLLSQVDNLNSCLPANMESLMTRFNDSALPFAAKIKKMMVEPPQMFYLSQASSQLQMGRNSRLITQLAQAGTLALNLHDLHTLRRIIEMMELLQQHDLTPLLTIKLNLLQASYFLAQSHVAQASELISRLIDKYFSKGESFQQGYINERIEAIRIKALCFLAAGRPQAARSLVQGQITLFQQLGAPLQRAQLELILARIEKESNNVCEALLLADKVMKMLAGGNQSQKAELYLLRGELCWELASKVDDKPVRESILRAGLNCLNKGVRFFLELGELLKIQQVWIISGKYLNQRLRCTTC